MPVQVGEKAEAREYGPLTTRMFVRYAGASGDFNPLHYDDQPARAAGYTSVFSQGLHSAALLASFAADWLGAENVRRFAVRFREQVWPDDVRTCSARSLRSARTEAAVSSPPNCSPPGRPAVSRSARRRTSCSPSYR